MAIKDIRKGTKINITQLENSGFAQFTKEVKEPALIVKWKLIKSNKTKSTWKGIHMETEDGVMIKDSLINIWEESKKDESLKAALFDVEDNHLLPKVDAQFLFSRVLDPESKRMKVQVSLP
jgi:hypothetical protein